MTQASRWVADQLSAAGRAERPHQSDARPSGRHRRLAGRAGQPTILVYGHYDVQPPDPLDKWHSPPFEPTVRDGRLYARGVSDDKGPMLIPIVVAEAFLRTAGSCRSTSRC